MHIFMRFEEQPPIPLTSGGAALSRIFISGGGRQNLSNIDHFISGGGPVAFSKISAHYNYKAHYTAIASFPFPTLSSSGNDL